ncbi:Protein YLS [Trema orientale]|uniref:Protein YLS n=1 Tax=Trema orientale TaxID=63057 RepID=A0A2P5EC54_TREOI|nr:Protein YLS [Trema orientale]
MPERRRISCCCRCGPLVSCFCILYGATIISFFFALYLFWLIVRSHNIQFGITDASITEFNLVMSNIYASTTLHYNLALNLTVPTAGYGGKSFAAVTVTTPFHFQGKENMTVLPLVFKGHGTNYATPLKGREIVEQYRTETIARAYTIDLKLDLRIIRLRYRKINTGHLR